MQFTIILWCEIKNKTKENKTLKIKCNKTETKTIQSRIVTDHFNGFVSLVKSGWFNKQHLDWKSL